MTDLARQREGEAAVSGPTTEAGRALYADWLDMDITNRKPPRGLVVDQIHAIEAEAHAAGRAAALGEVRERVEQMGVGGVINRTAVLAALDDSVKGKRL